MITLQSRRALLAGLVFPVLARAQERGLSVVSTFSILADFVRQIVAEGEGTSLVPPDGDPHEFQPRPTDLNRLRIAAVVVENGFGLEGWLSRLVQASGFRGRRVVATEGITPRRLQEGGRAIPDPHVWQDPLLAARMVRTIGDALAAAEPARADAYRLRAETYGAKLAQLDAETASRIAPVPEAKRRIITTHDAFGYYGARYGITFVAPQGLSTDAEPSPRALASLASQMRRDGIRTVFLENMADPRLPAALAREAGATVGAKLYSDSLSGPGGPAPTYIDLIRYNTAQFVAAMA